MSSRQWVTAILDLLERWNLKIFITITLEQARQETIRHSWSTIVLTTPVALMLRVFRQRSPAVKRLCRVNRARITLITGMYHRRIHNIDQARTQCSFQMILKNAHNDSLKGRDTPWHSRSYKGESVTYGDIIFEKALQVLLVVSLNELCQLGLEELDNIGLVLYDRVLQGPVCSRGMLSNALEFRCGMIDQVSAIKKHSLMKILSISFIQCPFIGCFQIDATTLYRFA